MPHVKLPVSRFSARTGQWYCAMLRGIAFLHNDPQSLIVRNKVSVDEWDT